MEQSRKPELPQEELVTIKGEIEKIEKTVTSNEKAIRARLLPDDFLDSLKDEVNKLKQDSGREGTVKVIQAKTQADLVIEHLAVTGIIDGAVANDCDFVVVAGKSMMLIEDFKLGKPASKKLPKSVVSIKLAAEFYSVLHEAVVTVLKMKADRIKKAAYDLLETDDLPFKVSVFDTNNQLKNTTTHSVIYNLPKAEGIKMQASESQRSNRGVGNSRMKLSILESLRTISASGDGIESELAEARMEQQRAHEMNSKDSDIGIISPALQKASGLYVHETKSPSRGTKGKLKNILVGEKIHTPRIRRIDCHPFQLEATSSESKNRISGRRNATLVRDAGLRW